MTKIKLSDEEKDRIFADAKRETEIKYNKPFSKLTTMQKAEVSDLVWKKLEKAQKRK